MKEELELEIFRAGDYGPKGEWSEDSLDQIARDYDPGEHEAPVTLDHAQTGPALGWVASVRRSGDRLLARLRGLNLGFIKSLREGAFKKRSVEIYGSLPNTGRPYLKAVSFLGAAAPVVKGLRDPIFAGEAPSTSFQSELDGAGLVDFAKESATAETPERRSEESAEKFGELQRDLKESGRWMPTWERQGLREFFSALATLEEIAIASDRTISPAEWFADFLKTLPAHLPMGEVAPRSTARPVHSIPAGANVSAASIELHRRAVSLCESRPHLSYSDALIECSRI